MQTSIVPNQNIEHTTYLLMDEIGEYGNVWREMSEGEATEATVVQWMIDGEINRPVKIVAFNTEEGWSRDITHDIATKLLDLNKEGVALGAVARDFVERITGQTPIAVA